MTSDRGVGEAGEQSAEAGAAGEAGGAEGAKGLVGLGLAAVAVGVAAGLVGAGFRLSLVHAEQLRERLIGWAKGGLPVGVGLALVVLVCGVAAGVAAWLVRRFSKDAAGSGIPHVERVLKGEVPPAGAVLIPVKFVGGTLAIGAGLALGREGPSVQMGASIAHVMGRWFRMGAADCMTLMAAGAGAGLATAFNAPMAGAAFVLEELLRRFDVRATIAVFGASAGAITVSRRVLGDGTDFELGAVVFAGGWEVVAYAVFGLVAGVLGVMFNRVLLGTMSLVERLDRWPAEWFAGVVGCGVGVVAWYAPGWVGGGDGLSQAALSGDGMGGVFAVVMLFGFRLILGSLSYAARTPGGLFAPMLVLGAQSGWVFGTVWERLGLGVVDPRGMAVVGMAAFFAAAVRAPLTGVILVIEMTGAGGGTSMLLPMLAACFAAMWVPTVLGNAPVYEALGERARGRK